MDQLQAMRAFTAVAGTGSFAEAGRRLRLSTSAISRGVAELEDALGILLLTRTTRSVRLTERGALYLESCRQILDDLDMATKRARGEDAIPHGLLTVTAPLVFGRLHVLPIVQALLAAHPALDIRLTLSDRNAHLVEDGIDAAIRIGELTDSGLIALRLGAVSPVLVASPAYLERRGMPDTPAALGKHDLIAFEGANGVNEWRFGASGKPVRIRPRLIVNSADAAIAAAESGLGIVRGLSYQIEDKVRAGKLSLLLGTHMPAASPVSLVYPQRRIGSANLNVFLDAVRNAFRAAPVRPASDWDF